MESETALVTPPASVPAPALETPTPGATTNGDASPQPGTGTPVEDTTPPTLAKHAEELGNQPRDPSGRYVKPPKHRTQRDGARAEDVPRIKELTAKQRAAEAERDSLKAELETLRQQQVQPPAAPAPTPIVPAVAQSAPKARETAPDVAIGEFPDPMPKIEDFASQDDQYQAHTRALVRWDLKKEKWEADQERAQTEASQEVIRLEQALYVKNAAFEKTHPDFWPALKAGPQETMTPLMGAAILRSDKSSEIMYYLAQHPDTFYELMLQTHGKDVDDVGLATTTRLLERRVQTVPTGSVVPPLAPSPPVPKPPNPVRTGPMKSADEPPADVHSLSEHSKAWGVRRR